jgi:hypothetical protein
MAVYGPRAAAVLEQAGIAAERIAVVGPAHFDGLVRAFGSSYRPWTDAERVILLASQPATPWSHYHTPAAKAGVLRAALAVAAAVEPARLVVKPHPTEDPAAIAGMLDSLPIAPRVAVEIDRQHDLHQLLPSAWLMVTAYSQSTFEAVIAGVPTISINLTGSPYAAALAEDGIALPASGAEVAVEVALSLRSEERRQEHVRAARAGLHARLGTLDGRATERTADLMSNLAIKGSSPAPDDGGDPLDAPSHDPAPG